MGRTMKAIAGWLGPAYGGGLELRPDLDAIEALSTERDALWSRVDKATFLTTAEKRTAVGYGADAAEGDGAVEDKFNPGQPRWPKGRSDGGRWSGQNGGAGLIPVQSQGRSGYPIDLSEEESVGGHTIERHVAKPKEYLLARILQNRTNIPMLGYVIQRRELRAGSFQSLESANKLVNSTISQNQSVIDGFLAESGWFARNQVELDAQFKRPTVYEAYAKNPDSQPFIRDTYGVTVRIARDPSIPKGYFVISAWPSSED